MQGYIIKITPCKEEDLIVHILTKDSVLSAYRFYGARHSTINLGYKIDCELIYSVKSNLPQLRNILHLANSWQYHHEKMMSWQRFVILFYDHLKGVQEVDEFYFLLLDEVCERLDKQNAKRLQVEAYVKLLSHEGRLCDEMSCFLCEEKIENNIALARGFLPCHASCIHSKPMDFDSINYLFRHQSTLMLDDELVKRLWQVMMEGL